MSVDRIRVNSAELNQSASQACNYNNVVNYYWYVSLADDKK